jgi:predicted nucleotidyltransferase
MPRGRGLFFLHKRRRWLYRKLVRIMDRVDKGNLPMAIKEVYIFGGFLRNKERPKDIDLLLVYDSDLTLRMYEAVGRKGDLHWRLWEMRRSPSHLRHALKENAERSVDINISPSLEEYQRDLIFPVDPVLLIWTPESRDWRSMLSSYFQEHQLEARPLLARALPRARSPSRYRSPRRSPGIARASSGRPSLGAIGFEWT